MNISQNGESIKISVKSGCLVFVDPINVESIKNYLIDREIKTGFGVDIKNLLIAIEEKYFGGIGDVMGYYPIEDFQPGVYRFYIESIDRFNTDRADKETKNRVKNKEKTVFITDSASVFVIDSTALLQFSIYFSYDDFDEKFLAAKHGDYSYFDEIAEKLGGKYFAFISSPGYKNRCDFEGDGCYTVPEKSFFAVK